MNLLFCNKPVGIKSVFRKLRMTGASVLLMLALSPASLAVSTGNNLPDIGTAGLSALTLEKERVIGDLSMRQIRGSYPLVHDPVLQEHLETVGYRIVTATKNPIHPFKFFWVNETSINAFAFFGGHIGVHVGLYLYADTESQIASVVAHEIAHVNQRHLARRIESQMQNQPATIGAALGSIILAVIAPQAGIAALQTTLGVSQQMTINFTRKNEAEADRIGMQALVAAGYDPYAAADFFEKMAAQYRYVSTPPAFLLTHPIPESRVADAELRAQQFPRKAYPVSVDFEFAKARIEARYSGKTAKIMEVEFERRIKKKETSFEDSAIYGLALAQFDAGNAKKARATIKPLLTKYPRNLFVIDAITDIDMSTGNQQAAEARLADIYGYMPNNQVITLNYANILIQQNKTNEAVDILNRFRVKNPENMVALNLLSDAYQKQGNTAMHYSAMADRLALMLQYDQAITMLERALRATPDDNNIEIVKLEAKVRQFRNELARLKAM
ncbi:M48 family metalloprotease [Neiella marina]|uniref:Putative beta-barrel assembly-enhancing protease n=1 Tax=Neiella holothuriorum TaxID=2870530 RepID=A0ABS7EIN8_9GAMM|nr:M48 family metalloprotease [Neiella holothuriorum]MBW8192199.1 M48 family metalloprotease [Neiella holothuriorum]